MCIFRQADYDRCRQAAPERRCQLFLEILKKEGVEGYKALCAALDTSQPFIKAQLDATAAEEGDEDLVYVNVDIMEDRYKEVLAEKDGEIADLRSSVQRQEQNQQKSLDQADLKETIKKDREEHRSQIEKQNEEAEALKMQLSNLSKDLQHTRVKCETLEKSVERLEDQNLQKYLDQAELEETIKKEREEHRSQMEMQNEEAEALKMQLSNLNKDLQNSRARCETLEKRLRDEQEAYDALVGAPRSQSPDRMDNTEQVQHAGQMGSGERMCQFSTQSCCDGSQLRLLPCLHSACKPCLDHQATQAEENCIHCPSCGLDFTMEKTTVDHVRRNEAAYKVNVDGEMKCSYIDEDHDAKAVVYCHECDDKLCSDCHKHHDTPKRNRNHRVTEIDQSTNIPKRQWLKEASCRDHPDNKLQLYDHTCKKTVCLICVHGAHKDHKNEDLYQAYDVAKGQLEEQVKKQQLKLEDVTGRMKTVTSHQTELRTTQRRLEQVATKVCKGVAAKLLHRQRQLIEEIQVSLQSPYRMV
ncbi:protein PML-like [Haliotis rubra]|uniref:protein PML-like n=1 Tax=Haliotis rubra TaxID=36100 RepID=UPI001EE5E970|nr:protein PML-like [Haliotis rubra]